MTLALGDQMKAWVDEMVGKNRDLEEEVKTLTLKLENCKGQVDHLQAKIHDLEEEVKILKSVMSFGEKDVSDFSTSHDLLEENKSLRLEQLELTVKYQMRKMWTKINLELKDNRSTSDQQKQRQIEMDSDMVGQQLMSTAISEQDVPTETNPLENEKILNKIFDSLPRPCLFKCRRLCKLWNKLLVPKINQNGNNTRLRIVHPLRGEILDIIEAGRLEYSTCTNIYFKDSMEFNPSVFERFLDLIGKNIKVLHYGGSEVSDLKKVLKMCAHNLESLSLRKLSYSGSKNGLYENDEESKLIFPKLENITFVSGNDGNIDMRRGLSIMKDLGHCPAAGECRPSKAFLIDIFEASPKLHSLSCRLFHSRILEALSQTNSYSKLTSLCLKSRVEIPQLRSLVSAKMRLKILHLEGLCVTIHTHYHDYIISHCDKTGGFIRPDPNNPELMEFAPLLLEFLQTQASTLEYLKLDLFTERSHPHPDIPTHILLNHFPRMPNLITLVVGRADGSTIFPFEMSTLAELFPNLRNLLHNPYDDTYESYSYCIDQFEEMDEDFPANYPVSPNASFSVKNIRGVEISPDLAEFFPFITELHLDGNIGSLDAIPFHLPRLKHFYYTVNLEYCGDDGLVELIRILNGFMTGVSREECQRTEEYHEVRDGFEHLNGVQFARSRPSIFDLNDLETLDFNFSCGFLRHIRGKILPAIEVLISWGISRMTHLKKLRFQVDLKVESANGLPDSCDTLLEAFRNRNNLETHSQGYWPGEIGVEKRFNFELNLNHHTSEWDQFKFFCEDPDIWDLGLYS